MMRTLAITGLVMLLAAQSDVGRAQWVQTNGPGNGPSVYAFAVIGNNLFAGSDGPSVYDLLSSTNTGESWNPTTPVIPGNYPSIPVTALLSHGSYLFAIPSRGLFRSNDNGITWMEADSGINGLVSSIVAQDSILYAGTDGDASYGEPGGSIFKSTDEGQSWIEVNIGLPNALVSILTVSEQTILASTDSGLYRSTNNGSSWESANNGLPSVGVTALGSIGQNFFAAMQRGGVFRSTDGLNWDSIDFGKSNVFVSIFVTGGSTIYSGSNGIYRSTDSGNTWIAPSASLPINTTIQALAVDDTNLIAATQGGGIFRSTDKGQSWIFASAGIAESIVNSIAVSGTKLFAGLDDGAGLFRTSDEGTNWIRDSSNAEAGYLFSLSENDSVIFATDNGYLYRSTNAGVSWDSVFNAVMEFTSFTSIDSNVFVAGVGGIYRSTDKGLHWNVASSTLPNVEVYSLAVNSAGLFAGTFGSGVFRSTDFGASWKTANTGIESTEVYALTFIGSSIFAGINDGNHGIARSTDSGNSWTMVINGLPSIQVPDVYDFAVIGSNIFAGSDNGLFLSTNKGEEWIAVDTGLPYQTVTSLATIGPNLFAATLGNGVWRRPLSEMIPNSSVAQTSTPLSPPQIQSYPNPFSSQATITFTNPNAGYVEVTILNLLGSEVARLFTGELAAGEHSFVWDMPAGLPDGMYECVVNMGGQTQRVSLVHLQ